MKRFCYQCSTHSRDQKSPPLLQQLFNIGFQYYLCGRAVLNYWLSINHSIGDSIPGSFCRHDKVSLRVPLVEKHYINSVYLLASVIYILLWIFHYFPLLIDGFISGHWTRDHKASWAVDGCICLPHLEENLKASGLVSLLWRVRSWNAATPFGSSRYEHPYV